MTPSRIIIGLAGLFLVVITILAIVSTQSGGSLLTLNRPEATPLNVTSYANSDTTWVRFTTESGVIANEKFKSSTITVGRQSRIVEVMDTYEKKVATNRSFVNNQPAYDDLLAALQNAGFTLKNNRSNTVDDAVGRCPQGVRYRYELLDGTRTVFSYWSSSCDTRAIQTFNGNATAVRQLFLGQVPDTTLQTKINLN